MLSPDVRLDADGTPRIAAAGWQESTGVALDEFLTGFLSAGLIHILCTDISRDGKLTGPNSALYAQLVKRFPALQIQASGGVSSLDDLRVLQDHRSPVRSSAAPVREEIHLQEASRADSQIASQAKLSRTVLAFSWTGLGFLAC